jgi:hypothetical protein
VKAFIIFRDRARYAQLCLSALLTAGLEPVIVDQGSSWVSALSWLTGLEKDGIPVLYRGGGHPRGLWTWAPFREAAGTADRYVVTDCDVVPSEDCPPDWPAWLSKALDEFPGYCKAALGLRTDNLPEHYQRREHVITWEAQFWQNPVAGGLYPGIADTTLAMYLPLSDWPGFGMSALRTGFPYVADHLAWHEDLDNLDDELTWYHEHAEPGISYWTTRGRSAWGD